MRRVKTIYFMVLLLVIVGLSACHAKKELSVYVVENEPLYLSAIKDFGKEYPNIKMSISTFMSYDELLERANAEMMGGKGPDVLLFNSFDGVTDPRKLALSNAFVSLNEQVSTLGEDKALQVFMEAGKVDAEQYFLPFSWNVIQGYTNEEILDKQKYDTIDMYGVLGAEMERLSGKQDLAASSVQLHRTDIANYMLEIADVPLIDDNQVIADKEDVCEVSQFLKKLYDDIPHRSAVTQKYNNDLAGAITHLSFLVEDYSFMHNLRYYQSTYYNAVEKEVVCIPFTQLDGTGITAQVVQYGAINANSDLPEDAWKLMEYIFHYSASMDFAKYDTDVYYAPVSNIAYEKCIEELATQYGQAPNKKAAPLNEKNRKLLETFPDMIDTVIIPNRVLGDLIQECLEPYLTSEKEFDKCYEMLLQKLQIYLAE